MSRLQVGVAGAAGKMGEAVVQAVSAADDMELVEKIDPSYNRSLSQAVTQTKLDVIVDFTEPSVALENALACVENGVHVVIGTTGFDLDPLRTRRKANAFVAPNFAVGAVLMMQFAAQAAKHMAKAEIIELHHDRKLDRPSGTAARTAELMGTNPPIHSVRLPGLVANQEVIFGDLGQTLTIRHDTTDRTAFMPGVLLAIRAVPTLEQPLTVGLETLLFP